MSKLKFPAFEDYACVGDRVQIEYAGLTITATLHADDDSNPADADCYTEENIADFSLGNWSYVGVVLDVRFTGGPSVSDDAASLWGCECNIIGTNEHLTGIANDLLSEAIACVVPDIVEVGQKALHTLSQIAKLGL